MIVKGHCSYLGKTGYNYHSRNFFKSLFKIYPDLKIRNFTVCPESNEYLNEIDKKILSEQTLFCDGVKKEYPLPWNAKILDESKDPKINIVLNHVDHYYFYDEYNGSKIAYVVWETTEFPEGFFNKLLEFDQLWVPSNWQKYNAINQGYPKEKIYVIPEAIDEDLSTTKDIELDEYNDGRFKFLLFGRWEYRKSTKEIIETFLKTFKNNESVDIIINVDNQFDPNKLSTEDKLKKYSINDPRIKVKRFLSRQEYINYLKKGQVLVTCSRGEGWNRPLQEALVLGTPAIYSNYGPQLEFTEGYPLSVNVLEEKPANLSDETSTIPGKWCEPDFNHLSHVMRDVYNNYEKYKDEAIKVFNKIKEKYQPDIVAKKASEALNSLNNILFVTGGDKSYIPIIEKLAKSINIFSKHKLVIYGINCDVDINNPSVIIKKINLTKTKDSDKWYFKQRICVQVLQDFPEYEKFVWIDGDSIVNQNIDSIEKYFNELENYPIPDVHHLKDYSFFKINDCGEKYDITYYNQKLIEYFGIKRNVETLAHACLFIFNKKCGWFFKEIIGVYEDLKEKSKDDIIICNDEGLDNLLRWKYGFKKFLPQSNFETGFNFDYINDFLIKDGPYDFGDPQGWNYIPENKGNVIYFHGNKDIKKAEKILELIQSDKNDHIFVVCSHPNNEVIIKETIKCIESIKPLNTEILLSCHYPAPQSLVELVDYYVYDKNNEIIQVNEYDKLNIVNGIFFENPELRVDITKPLIHDYAVFTLIKNAYILAKQKGKKFLHVVNYDCVLNPELYKKQFIQPLKNNNLCYINWDEENKNAMVCYLFSIRIDAFDDLFSSINNKYDYFKNKLTAWQLDSIIFNYAKNKKLKLYYSDYPKDDLNKLNINGSFNVAEFVYPCIDEENQVYILIKNINTPNLLSLQYNDCNEIIELESENHYIKKVGGFVPNKEISIYKNDTKIYTYQLPDSPELLRKYNKATTKSRKITNQNNINLDDCIIIVCSHSNTKHKKETLLNCLNSLKGLNIKTALCSHYKEDPEIYSLVDYYIYDKEDPVVCYNQYEEFAMTNSIFYENPEYRIDWINPFTHDYAVFKLMQNGYRLARNLKKEYVCIIEYDCLIKKDEFVEELLAPLKTYDVSHNIWDRNIKDLLATYLFSFKTKKMQELFESINSTEEYYKNRIRGWNLERLFWDYCKNNNLKLYLNNYPDDLMNLNSMFKQSNMFQECRLCVDERYNLYIHIRSNKNIDAQITYITSNTYSLNHENTILLGKYQINEKVVIQNNDKTIFEKTLTEPPNTFYKLNKLVKKNYVKLEKSQNKREFEMFLDFLKKQNINNFLEIGTDLGGSFLEIGLLASGKKISIDLPYDSSDWRKEEYKKRNSHIQSLLKNTYLLERNSHDPQTIVELKNILKNEKLDLLFIDGDHSIDGVSQDFLMYSELVRDGGIIAFHDIAYPEVNKRDLINVWEFWNCLEGDKIEFKDNIPSSGIGVIIKNEKIKLKKPSIKIPLTINCHFVNGANCEILSDYDSNYLVRFIDNDKNEVLLSSKVKNNQFAKHLHSYYITYRIQVSSIEEKTILFDECINLKNQRVYIHIDSKGLGDTIAWFPYIEKFKNLHGCEVVCSTFHNSLFKNKYSDITFVPPGSVVDNIHAMYEIGIFNNEFKEPHDHKKIPLQKVASNILGLEYKEEKPRIYIRNDYSKEKEKLKLIGISTSSTCQAKYWNNEKGWEEIIKYLKQKGYNVVELQLDHSNLNNVIKPNCNDIQTTISWLTKCKCYIGLSSGASWLAWALNIPVVMISGLTSPFNEFECIRIAPPPETCQGCWHEYEFDKGDWDWCPRHKNTNRQFECTKKITPKMVIERIEREGLL